MLAVKEAASKIPRRTLGELKDRYISLIQGIDGSQKREYKLEAILQELRNLSSLEVTEPFRVVGEQIDGAVKFKGEHYLVEAKWQDKASANEPIYQFAAKIEGQLYGRGLFISINGFSENVVESLVHGKAIKTIFVDGGDLIMVLEDRQSLSEIIDKKVKAAQTRGKMYINAVINKRKQC